MSKRVFSQLDDTTTTTDSSKKYKTDHTNQIQQDLTNNWIDDNTYNEIQQIEEQIRILQIELQALKPKQKFKQLDFTHFQFLDSINRERLKTNQYKFLKTDGLYQKLYQQLTI